MKIEIYVPDIECESCVKLIKKKFTLLQGLESVVYNNDSIIVDYDEALIKPDSIISVIQNLGFRASLEPFERKNLKERIKNFSENKEKYEIEIRALLYTVYGFLVLLGLEAIAYFGFLNTMPNFLANYGWWLLYLNISIAALGSGIWHIFSYRTKVTCMVGMMIGMTIGMQTGMMIGAIIGATNGFFIGAMTGMLLGVFVGVVVGKCCGIMGIMEGAMAGLMGGTMGPMISLMMFADHLLWFMPFYIAVNVFILAGMSYMILEELVEDKKDVQKAPIDFFSYASMIMIAAFVLIIIML